MEDVIKRLNLELENPSYREVWIANISMTQLDAEYNYRKENAKLGKYLNY